MSGRLIIVAGAGGAGKSFFLKMWEQNDSDSIRIKKFVSDGREPREIEIKNGESDLIFSKKYNPNTIEGKTWYKENGYVQTTGKELTYHTKTYDFKSQKKIGWQVYNYNGNYYEVDLKSIDKALEQNKNPIVIVRKCETIKELIKRYRDSLIIYVQSILSGEDLVNKLIALGESEEDAKKRQGRNKKDLENYIENIQQLPKDLRVVVNDFDEKESGAVFTQIEDIYREEIENYKAIYPKKKTIFVIQSYKDNYNDRFEAIEKAAKIVLGNDVKVQKGNNNKTGAYSIPNSVWNMIEASDCIICDVTNDRCDECQSLVKTEAGETNKKYLQGTSSNVWIELGYTISTLKTRNVDFEKKLIIVKKVSKGNSGSIIPIDLGGTSTNVVTYSDTFSLMKEIENRLKNMYKE